MDGQGYYYVVSQASGMCLDISNLDPSPGLQIIQAPCSRALSQHWRWVALPNP
jgi:hypothetical protein